MNADLVCKLPVIISCAMQRYMCISYVMTNVSRVMKNFPFAFFLESICQAIQFQCNIPWHNAMAIQCILSIFCNCVVPFSGQTIKWIFSVAIKVKVMMRGFIRITITPLVRVNSMLRDELNVHFVERNHLRRQCEYRHVIYFLMRPKAP